MLVGEWECVPVGEEEKDSDNEEKSEECTSEMHCSTGC